jgi:hypothetical protein
MEISNGLPLQPLRRSTAQAHRKSALESPPCSTDLMASASQNHRPGITLSTRQRSSVSPTSRRRLTSNHHRPKSRPRPSPSPDLTTPASRDCRLRITQGTAQPQIGPPTLPRERWQAIPWPQSTTAAPCSCGYSFKQALHQNHNHSRAKHSRCAKLENMPADGQPPCSTA